MIKLVDLNALRCPIVFGNDIMISFVEGRIKSAEESRDAKFTFMVAEVNCGAKYYGGLVGIAKKVPTPEVAM